MDRLSCLAAPSCCFLEKGWGDLLSLHWFLDDYDALSNHVEQTMAHPKNLPTESLLKATCRRFVPSTEGVTTQSLSKEGLRFTHEMLGLLTTEKLKITLCGGEWHTQRTCQLILC